MLSSENLEKLRKAGRISGEARELGLSLVAEGVKLYDVAQEVEGYIREHGCGLAFPCNISRNEIAAHYEVGTKRYTELVETSKRARNTVAEFIGDGVTLGEIGRAVQMSINRDGFVPIENLCGHQIEQYNLHAGMSVPSYDSGDKQVIKAGMTVAIEPFATDGKGYVVDGKFGNIVRLARDKPVSDPKVQEFLDYVKEEFHQFPFCARSCEFPDAEKHVRNLMRHGILAGYATLVEAGGGMVSQHEYTFYIDGHRGEVTTLP